MNDKHAVALVPGFMGFDHQKDLTYFADRFIAGLRSALEARGIAKVPVVPVSTLPIGALAARQEQLIRDLGTLDGIFGSPQWHIVGHSTGGLDGVLLARKHRLVDHAEGSRFAESDPLDLPRLRSVTTIAAPLHGTSLARSPIAEMTHEGLSFDGVRDLLTALLDARQRDAAVSRLKFVSSAAVGGPLLFAKMIFGNELARDLDPAIASALVQTDNRRAGITISCVATAAPEPSADTGDRLFRELYRWTSEHTSKLPAPPSVSFADVPRIEAPGGARVGAIRITTNDGVVDTFRQIDDRPPIAIVAADHADVIGRYQRVDFLDKKVVDHGLLTSGAKFGDDEFFALIDVVAGRIATAARA